MENTQQNTALVLFRVGPVLCCAPAQPIQSIIAPPNLTRPPGSTEARPGIFHHGDHVVQVSDLRVRFGISESQRKQPGRLIITQQENGYVAFWVDDIIEVIQSPKEGWGKLPPYIPRGIFGHTLLLNEQIHLYVEIEKLGELPDEDYLSQYLQQFAPKQETVADVVEETGDTEQSPEAGPEPEQSQAIEETPDVEQATTDNHTAQAPPSEVMVNGEAATPKPVTETKTGGLEETPAAHSATEDNKPVSHPAVQDEVVIEAAPAEGQMAAVVPLEKPAVTPAASEIITEQEKPAAATSNLLNNEPRAEPAASAEILASQPQEPARVEVEPVPSSDSKTSAQQADTNARSKEKSPAASAYKLSQNHELIPPEKKTPAHKSGSRPAIAIAASILMLVAAGAAYLLFLSDKDKQALPPSASLVTQEKPASIIVTESSKQQPVTEETDTSPTEQNVATEVAQAEPVEPVESEEPVVEEKATAEPAPYHAEIKHDTEGVTIEIEAPENEPVLNEAKPDNRKAASVSSPDDENTQRAVREITHVVIKGDTLWDIAQHYVNNPYKYPELARLSNIKNPDRIYPGNRVRIVHKSQGR